MFDDMIVLDSAVSAFNNAALAAPAFMWYGILAVPVFVMVYFCGNAFLDKLGWTSENLLRRVSVVAVGLAFLWLLMMGGNYSVLRDQISVMPYLSATVLFLVSLYISSNLKDIRLPQWSDLSRRARFWVGLGGACVLCGVGTLDIHAWWGPVLQLCAFLFGVVLGRRMKAHVPAVLGCVAIMFLCVTAILMQPELFRFGQLGSLTIVHMLGLAVFGMLAAATLVLWYVKPSGRIHSGVFGKLKWMMRFAIMLGFVLFFLTESVPVFLGITGMAGAMVMMSVLHAEKLPDYIAERMFALTLGAFGIITTVPAVTALGILYWVALPRGRFWSDIRFLL